MSKNYCKVRGINAIGILRWVGFLIFLPSLISGVDAGKAASTHPPAPSSQVSSRSPWALDLLNYIDFLYFILCFCLIFVLICLIGKYNFLSCFTV